MGKFSKVAMSHKTDNGAQSRKNGLARFLVQSMTIDNLKENMQRLYDMCDEAREEEIGYTEKHWMYDVDDAENGNKQVYIYTDGITGKLIAQFRQIGSWEVIEQKELQLPGAIIN